MIKTLILCGGQHSRMGDLISLGESKCMLEINEKPILHHIIDEISSQGFKDIVIYCNPENNIKEYFGNGDIDAVRIEYIYDDGTGTAQAIRRCRDRLSEIFLVIYSDMLFSLDLLQMLGFHIQTGGIMTVSLRNECRSNPDSIVETDENSIVTRFVEKPTADRFDTYRINNGIYVFSDRIFNFIPSSGNVDITDLMRDLINNNKNLVYGYQNTGMFVDLGTKEKYLTHGGRIDDYLKSSI